MTPLEIAIRREWDIGGLASDINDADWERTEPRRIDRRIRVASYDGILRLARRAADEDEWKEAVKNGVQDSFADEYLEALAEAVQIELGQHVYGTFDDDSAFLGQYEDVPPESPDPPKPGPGPLDWRPEE